MKFTFKSKEQGFGSPEFAMEFEVDQIDDVLFYFEQFLRGAGYNPEGKLEFVSDQHDEVDNYKYQVNLEQVASMTSPINWTSDQLKNTDIKFTL